MVHLAGDFPPSYPASRVRDGAWLRVRPGAYVEAAPDDRHERDRAIALARIVAIREQLTAPYVLSHESAAMLWGLPLLGAPDRTHVIGTGNPSAEASDVVRHVHQLPDQQRTIHLGHAVTTLERTVTDCAMALSAHAGLVVADAALHVGVTREGCLEIFASMAGRRGVIRARAVLQIADDGAESPGESSARFVFLRAGLPLPETQIEIRTRLGTYWTDLGWREWRLAVEYDGRVKYSARGSAAEVVVQEKRRQEAIEEAGWRVLRLTKEDLRQPSQVIQRVARHLPPSTFDRLRPRSTLNRTDPR